MSTITITITVPTENVEECVDALSETLNMLALDAVLNDANDDAWRIAVAP